MTAVAPRGLSRHPRHESVFGLAMLLAALVLLPLTPSKSPKFAAFLHAAPIIDCGRQQRLLKDSFLAADFVDEADDCREPPCARLHGRTPTIARTAQYRRQKPPPLRKSAPSKSRPQSSGVDSTESGYAEMLKKFERAAELGDKKQADKLYPKVLKLAPSSDHRLVKGIMLKVYANGGSPSAAIKFLKNKKGFGKLLRDAVASGSTTDALSVLQDWFAAFPSLKKDIAIWSLLIDAYAKPGRWEEVESIAQTMRSQGVLDPSIEDTNAALMSAYSKAGKHAQVAEVMERMKHNEIMPSHTHYGILLESLGKRGKSNRAMSVLDEMKQAGVQLDVDHYSSILFALAKEAASKPSMPTKALEFHQEMLNQGVQPNRNSHGAVVRAFARAGDVDGAKEQLRAMEASSISPTVVEWLPVIDALRWKGCNVEELEGLLEEMRSKAIHPDVRAYNAVMACHSKAGNMQGACDLLTEMERHEVEATVESHNIIVNAHVSVKNISGAMGWLQAMPSMRVTPDANTYGIIAKRGMRFPRARRKDPDVLQIFEDLLRNMASNGVQLERGSDLDAMLKSILGKPRCDELISQLGVIEVDDVLNDDPEGFA
eukprot:CAMPEP_0178382024 /NCGR_PEP_ID=MMETSP0689_2-20121128/6284_1 /TAXON_ID=160604 /ORGANISM="Amphidinium massartii, Strain CS-259" /LENGTH=598 /DNA_ID=CAMNT_0020002223 /DNA_START=21 /DNA_END=1814 /DNA_ORIENTATION=+